MEKYRGKQIQQSLIHHRIEKAISLGVNYILTTTGMDTNSGRNMERNGFKLAFAVNEYILNFGTNQLISDVTRSINKTLYK